MTVEDESIGALQADLLVPVPSSATEIGYLLSGSQDAFASAEEVSFVASDTVSGSIESGALIGNGNADILTVEDPVVGAL